MQQLQFIHKEQVKESRLTVAIGLFAMVVVLALLVTLMLNLTRQTRERNRVHEAAVTLRGAVEQFHGMVKADNRQRYWSWVCRDSNWTMTRQLTQGSETIATVALPAEITCDQTEPLIMKSGSGRAVHAVAIHVASEQAQYTIRVTPQAIVSVAETESSE